MEKSPPSAQESPSEEAKRYSASLKLFRLLIFALPLYQSPGNLQHSKSNTKELHGLVMHESFKRIA